MVRCDIGTTHCNNWINKYKKKNKVPLNVTKVRSEVMWVLPNVIIKKSECDKNRDRCDVGTT